MTAMTAASSADSKMPALRAGTLQGYLDSIQQIPVLTVQQEAALFQRFHEEEDLEAARRIIMSHLRYVAFIARGYVGYGLPLEDLIQQGNVGLMRSVKRFDSKRGVRLISFAVHWIKAEIHDYILRNWKIVKVATTKAQRKLFFNLRNAKRQLGWFNAEEAERVAKELGVKPEEVREMESRLSTVDESYEPLDADDEGRPASPSAYLTQGEQQDPAYMVAEAETESLKSKELAAALASLDARARDIVQARWLGERKASLKELSQKHGVSLERIRQIEQKAFAAMQPYLRSAQAA